MRLKQKITNIFIYIQQLPHKIRLLTIAIIVIVPISFFVWLADTDVVFSYSQRTCVNQPTFLPKINTLHNKDDIFKMVNDDNISIFGVDILSLKACFDVKKPFEPGVSSLSVFPLNGWFTKKTYNIQIPDRPVLDDNVLDKPISASLPLKLAISDNDKIFEYKLLSSDGNSSGCYIAESWFLQCELSELAMSQGKNYKLELIRTFKGQKIESVFKKNISTVDSVSIVGQSVKENSIIYDKPREFSFSFNKIIASGGVSLWKVADDGRQEISTKTSLKDNVLLVSMDRDLDRDSEYEFILHDILAVDGGVFEALGPIKFNTSGGPSVKNVNIGAVGVPLSHTITLTFDQLLNSSQNIYDYISVDGIDIRLAKNENKIYLDYNDAPACSKFEIKIAKGLMSDNNIVQDDDWSFEARTICHTVSTIGYSVEGRPITAYIFGSGNQTILYVGAIHGNELSTKYLMEEWINELEQNVGKIPINKKIVVVPVVNPDGADRVNRNNARNVDLNRNFGANDWQTNVYGPGNQMIVGGGGDRPLSEPESLAIADFTLELKPRLTLSYHGNAGYAIANLAGDSTYHAENYSNLSGYVNMTGVGGAFSYPITGTYDDWLRDGHNLASVLVELYSNVNSEFDRNKTALWAMANI